MEPWQWVLLGVMLALTPSLLVLAALLARTKRNDDETEGRP